MVAFVLLNSCLTFAQTPTCDSSLWNHVYHSYRLQVHTQCMTVTGVVNDIIYEADGDVHIRLIADSAYTYMLNSFNISGEYGTLVLEPVCVAAVTQTDAVASCQNFTNIVYIPNVGEHIEATGSYVTDNDHGWNEIHPVTKIAILGATGIPDMDSAFLNGFKLFPQPASDFINFAFDAPPHATTYISIYNAIGKGMGDYQLAETKSFNLNTMYLPGGVYLYTISQSKGILKSGQFVVMH